MTETHCIHVVIGLVLNKKKQVLIARRQKGQHLAGFWEFPGGKLEPSETPTQTLKRELLEEVNVTPIKPQPFMQQSHDYDDRTVFLDFWLVEDFSGEVAANEAQEIRWVALPELINYKFPEANGAVLSRLLNLG